MGSLSDARPPASRMARADSRPILVTVLVTGWLLLSGFGGLRALVVLGNAASISGMGDTDPMARAAAAAPDLVTDEMRQILAQREGRRALEKTLAGPLLLVAALGIVGAIGLLRRRAWSRALLLSVGVLAIGIGAFHAYRSIEIAVSPAAGLEANPDAQNALALVRAAAGIGLALQSIPLILAMALLRHPIVRDWVSVPGRHRPPADPWRRVLLTAVGAAVVLTAGLVLRSKGRSPAPQPGKEVSAASAPEPSETFRWGDQPITFSPPPKAWTRERHAEGVRRGVQFTRYAVPPSRIIVAEISVATAPSSVEEIFPQFRLTPEKFPSVDSVTVSEPVRAVVAGLPAFQTDYTMSERSMRHRGREFLTVARKHAFVFSLLGPEADLRVLESLVASVQFPAEPDGYSLRTTAEETPRDDQAGGDGTELRVGDHRVTVRIPAGWEQVDYGKRQEFRHGEARIVLVDAGPVQARSAGEIDDARVIDLALRLLDYDPRRWEIASKTSLRVDGRDALIVDTWDPLSHVPHERYFLVLNAGRLLVAAPTLGPVDVTKGPLDKLARSIRFVS